MNVLIFLANILFSLHFSNGKASEKPNVVIILADDMVSISCGEKNLHLINSSIFLFVLYRAGMMLVFMGLTNSKHPTLTHWLTMA
jgi:hypothetical protein